MSWNKDQIIVIETNKNEPALCAVRSHVNVTTHLNHFRVTTLYSALSGEQCISQNARK